MKQQVIYGVRLALHSTAWLGTTEDFYENILGDNNFATYDINKAHQFMEWMNDGCKVRERQELECIVEERATDFFYF